MKFHEVNQELCWQEEERLVRIIAPTIKFIKSFKKVSSKKQSIRR